MWRDRVFTLICLLMMQTVFSIRPEGVEFRLDTSSKLEKNILQESIVNLINGNSKAGWKASLNTRFANHTVRQFKDLLGVKPLPEGDLANLPVVSHNKVTALPKHFDAREGHCGACWAFGAVEVLSDRFCIHFGQNVSLSPNELVSCCEFCGDGCNGGYPSRAWNYFVSNGVVTEQCDPYFDTEGCSHPGCSPVYPTPACVKQCATSNLAWQNSKHFAVNAYKVGPEEQAIMAEIYSNGPVEVAFTVYEDFAHYKSGVYRHVTGEELGGHAVKLMGWGVSEEEGEKYWILANQWNRSWGDEGYFKILRGVNECGIEEAVVAGLPSAINTRTAMIGVLQTS
ncbi:hypothetical protein M569_05509 [Genlisea aurea]|uniref:Peptidase C1A papain C-terminal domain-containing protein n=1 Tax=Genlisea aurea TaxID=192259 RepID=S8E0P0_9LAMI|nr:hypothetical protein M569_05509 [Genlisea aurea]